jgi:hypothetical protein
VTPFPPPERQRQWLGTHADSVPTRYVFDHAPADDLRERIAAWLRFHGFNEGIVCATPGWIERDPVEYVVRAQVYARAPDGIGRLFDRREVEEHRSEGPPLPFPDIPDGQWFAMVATDQDDPVRMTVIVTRDPIVINTTRLETPT